MLACGLRAPIFAIASLSRWLLEKVLSHWKLFCGGAQSRWRSCHPVEEAVVSLEKLSTGGVLSHWRSCYSIRPYSSWSTQVLRPELAGHVQQHLDPTNSDELQNSTDSPCTVGFSPFIPDDPVSQVVDKDVSLSVLLIHKYLGSTPMCSHEVPKKIV